ncbi:MAG: hypothetical protein WC384_07085 [Prolixibacteraceae bacterium]|jgi:hypothetical protein
MMTEKEIRKLIQSGETITLLSKYFAQQPDQLDILIKIAFDDSETFTWRAAWMIDKIHEENPELIIPYFPAITEFVLHTKNSGKRRHFLKMLSLHDIPDENMALLLNFASDIFSDASEPVAVRVHAMQILFGIALKEPDFSGELIELIEHEIEYYGSAGIASRGRKLLKKLYSQRKSC